MRVLEGKSVFSGIAIGKISFYKRNDEMESSHNLLMGRPNLVSLYLIYQ